MQIWCERTAQAVTQYMRIWKHWWWHNVYAHIKMAAWTVKSCRSIGISIRSLQIQITSLTKLIMPHISNIKEHMWVCVCMCEFASAKSILKKLYRFYAMHLIRYIQFILWFSHDVCTLRPHKRCQAWTHTSLST